jgi:hypothetical protein
MISISIRSGGQTGVDRAALDAAIARGMDYCGWCPRGGWAEDFPNPPGVVAKYPHLRETPSSDPEQRTAWNVRDSDATLILVLGDDLARSPGTSFAKRAADLIFEKQCLVVDLSPAESMACASRWLHEAVAARGGSDEFVLHIAGPRESESPGIYLEARALLDALFAGDRA